MSKIFGIEYNRGFSFTIFIVINGLIGSISSNAAAMGNMPFITTSSAYKMNSLFFTFDYLSQTNTLGIVNESVKQPSYSSSILFYSKYNFDAGVSAIITDNSDTSFTEASTEFDFLAGYTFSLTDDLTLYPSYTHLEYTKNSYTLQSVFSDILQLDLYLDKKHYYGGITASYLFGSKNTFFASVQNAIGFDKEDFLIRNSYLSMSLELDINFGNKNYYNEFIYNEWNRDEFLSWIDEYYPLAYYAIDELIIRNGLEETKSRFFDRVNEYDPEVFKSVYTITSIDIMLPVYYSIGPFMFNFTSYISIPTFSSMFYEQNPLFIFNAGVAYSLNF
jgi:hypothetical protein